MVGFTLISYLLVQCDNGSGLKLNNFHDIKIPSAKADVRSIAVVLLLLTYCLLLLQLCVGILCLVVVLLCCTLCPF